MTTAEPLSKIATPGMFPEWPEHIGRLKRLRLKQGRMGQIALLDVECGPQRHMAFTFNPRLITQIETAINRSKILDLHPWLLLKGPLEAIVDGGKVEHRMRVIYLTDKTPYPLGAPLAMAAE